MRHGHLLLAALAALGLAAPPAGAKLVYVSDPAGAATIRVAGDDGSGARQLVPGTQPTISPDGSTVAFLRDRGSRRELRLIDSDRHRERRLLASRSVESVTFSPDSSLLAAEVGSTRLVIVEVDTGRSAILARGYIKGIAFSPDGRRIAYGRGEDDTARSRSDILGVSVRGGKPRPLTDDGRSLLPVWGPERIAFVKQKSLSRGGFIPAYDIWTMAPDGDDVRRLTRTKVPEGVSGLLPVEYSADGRRLVAQYVGQAMRVGFTVDPATGRTRALRQKIAFDLASDGSAVLTQSGGSDPAARHNLYAAPYAGGPSVLLARGAAFPDWSR